MNQRQRKKYKYPSREIICIACGKVRVTHFRNRDVCQACHAKEPTGHCSRCGRKRHFVEGEPALCPSCRRIVARPVLKCSGCLAEATIVDAEKQFCQKCRLNELKRFSSLPKQTKTKCSKCGEIKSSALLCRRICATCYTEERNGKNKCEGCNRVKTILIKSRRLCKHCYNDLCASRSLQKYIASYATPFLYNKFLFDLFVTSIDPAAITDKVTSRVKSFGQFLKKQPVPNPLSWEAIVKLLPRLSRTKRTIPKQIRTCLLDVGHMLAARGELENWETYIDRRYALQPIKRAPVCMRDCLRNYADWLWEKQRTFKTVRIHLDAVASFTTWCKLNKVKVPDDISPYVIDQYLQDIRWQWKCSTCARELTARLTDAEIPKICVNCGSSDRIVKIERQSNCFEQSVHSCLKVFFDWMLCERIIPANPVETKYAIGSNRIPHYPTEVIKLLCAYIFSSGADPTEALILYLILFHGLSGDELRRALIPTKVMNDLNASMLSDEYCLHVPARPTSCNNHSSGRPKQRIDFPPEFVEWLRPLLERFEIQRQQNLSSSSNQYLLVAPNRKKHNVPVSRNFVRLVVRRTSLQVLGAVCLPRILRMTSAVMTVQRGGAGCLRLMSWSAQQAFVYSWAPRKIVHPKPIGDLKVSRAAFKDSGGF